MFMPRLSSHLVCRPSEDTHSHAHTYVHQLNDENHGHRHTTADDKKTDALNLDKVDRRLEIATTALGRSNDLTSPSDDIRIEQHDEGFLPTPPGSTPMSPLKMTPGSPGDAHPYSPFAHEQSYAPLEGLASAYDWTAHYHHEYEEYTVYQDMEEHEGSEHSLRILTLHVTDEDDDHNEVSTINSAETYDTAATQNDGAESGPMDGHKHYSDEHLHLHHHHDSDDDTNDYQSVNVALETTTARHGDREEVIRREMTDCGCHHASEEERNGQQQHPQQGTGTKARTDVFDDDLCCPSSSVITLDACIRNFIKFTHCSVIEALEAVTLHPAVLLGIQETKGVIKAGADADLVFLSDDLFVKRVFVAGEEVDLKAIDVEAVEKF